MRKGKVIEPKFAVVLALAIVLVLIWYGYKADWFKDIGVENTGAVAAVSSTNGKLVTGAKAVSGSTSSPQPVIAVTSYPTFEMKYDSAGNENNLVVKSEYSVTAQGGKIYLPVSWGTMDIKNSLDQYAYPKTIETKSLDAVSVVSCSWAVRCYAIPSGKTVRFISRQVYNPLVMFGGVYNAKLNWIYFTTVENPSDNSFYYKPFPGQTSKLANITIVGEKSPYIYTTALNTNWGQKFTIQGARLTGTTPTISGCSGQLTVISQSDTSVMLVMDKTSFTTPLCNLTFTHPTYGTSNRALVTMDDVKVLAPKNGDVWARDQYKVIAWQAVCGSQYCPVEEATLKLVGKVFEGTIAKVNLSAQQWNWKVGTLESGVLPAGDSPYQVQLCRKNGFCVMSSGFFTITSNPTTGRPTFTFVSSDESVNVRDGADNDTGTFTLTYRVEAVGGPVFMSDISKAIGTTTPATVSDSQGVLYVIEKNGVPQLSGSQSIVTFTTSGGASDAGVTNGVRLDEGEEANFTLTVNRTNTGNSSDDGIYRVVLKGVGWNTTDKYGFTIYRDLIDYKTDPVSLN